MKKFLILCMVAMIFLSSCSWFEPKEDSAQQKDENKNIKAIDSLSSYSSIGAGLVNEDSRAFGNGKMKMLGIKKHSGEASVIHFVNENGGVISEDHYFTASLTSDAFSFYKIMFKDVSFGDFAYEGNNFEAAAGELYCLNNEDGSIYKLEGIQSMNASFGEYDCYNNVFVGSFKFQTGETILCKVYVDNGELKIEKKLNLDDFPEFKHIFMDVKENIFAYDNTYLGNYCHYNWVFPVNYVLSNEDEIYQIPNLGYFLGYNRIVYRQTNYREFDGVYDINNPVQTMKESLVNWLWNETKGELDLLDYQSQQYDVTTRPDGKKQYVRKSDGNILVEYFNNLELANLPTSEFIPPELMVKDWNSAHQGPCKDWGYSTIIYETENECYYLTKVFPSNNKNEHYFTKVTFLNNEHTKYEFKITFFEHSPVLHDIEGEFIPTGKKVFFIKDSMLRVFDCETLTTKVVPNTKIVRYHSIERADNNEVMFVGTNTSAEKMYYKINTDTMEISLIGTNPTFSSVSFHPISVTD